MRHLVTPAQVLSLLVGAWSATACTIVNPDHCGNRMGNASCPDNMYCNVCVAANDGCAEDPPEAACRTVGGTDDDASSGPELSGTGASGGTSGATDTTTDGNSGGSNSGATSDDGSASSASDGSSTTAVSSTTDDPGTGSTDASTTDSTTNGSTGASTTGDETASATGGATTDATSTGEVCTMVGDSCANADECCAAADDCRATTAGTNCCLEPAPSASCVSDAECCDTARCDDGLNRCCLPLGAPCTAMNQCCGLTCDLVGNLGCL